MARSSTVSLRGDVPRPTRTPVDQVLTREDWERALRAFEKVPTAVHVGRSLGVSPNARSVLRLLDEGIPALGLPPVRRAAQERARALVGDGPRSVARGDAIVDASAARVLEERVRLAREAETRETKLLGDAADQRDEEIRLVRANRRAAIALGTVNAHLLRGALQMASAIDRDLSALPPGVSLRERLGYLRTIAGIVQRTAEASQVAVKMERLMMGEPTDILQLRQGPSTKDMTPEEASEYLALANRAFARRAARSTVVDSTVEASPRGDADLTDLVGPPRERAPRGRR